MQAAPRSGQRPGSIGRPKNHRQRAILQALPWPEPQQLSAKIEPEPYPIDALPKTIRATMEEVAGVVKAPWP
ncbi:DNA primase [Candidatus Accumulibacter phosphatis]|uniref:DNA primase n=1 Tax=Candidatus Accumulibacter phosphatis TaxID=327160 RepID=A0A5S4EN23_9PROT|nr:DNA primase [Candidatus Accumulibacter phosphatis]